MGLLDTEFVLNDGSKHKGILDLVRYLVKKEVRVELDSREREANLKKEKG